MSGSSIHRLGQPYLLRCVPEYGGLFLSGKAIYAYIMRNRDQAMFNFSLYESSPTDPEVWALPGNLPGDLNELRGLLEEFKLGSLSLAYTREFDFPGNDDEEGSIPQSYTVWYIGPESLGIVGVEEIVFIPETMSFNAYNATPMSEGQVSVKPG